MNSLCQPSFNHCLILGLKNGLIEGDREIRQLKDKLFTAYMKDIEIKDKISDLKMNFDKVIRNMQTEIETLKKDLRKVEDDNMHLKFKFEQQQAFSESKVKEIEELKNENIRVVKMSHKDEYRSKYTTLRRKLRNILKKLRNDPDSKIVQDIASAIDDQNYGSSRSPLKTSNTCDNPVYNSVIKVNDLEIQIQQLSPALSTFSSIPSLSEKSPNFSSICAESDSMELESSSSELGFTTKVPNRPNFSNGLRKEEMNATSIFDPTSTEIVLRKSTSDILISKSTCEGIVSEEKDIKIVTLETPGKVPKNKLDIDQKILTNFSSPVESASEIGSKMEKLDISIPGCNFKEEKYIPVCETTSHKESNKCSITCDNDLHPNFEEIIKQPDVRQNPVERPDAEIVSSETTNEHTEYKYRVSSIEQLFFDEQALDNAVEDLLLEMAEPLKRNTEIESMRKFFEEFETHRDLVEEPEVFQSSVQKLDKTEEINHLVPYRNTGSAVSDDSKAPEITMKDIVPFLDEISKYESMLKDQTEFEEFVQRLKSEPHEDEAQKFTEPSEDAYVVVLQTSESGCTTNEEQLTNVRDEIWNDWEVMDSLNEIDLNNLESESQDCHVLEYTSVSSPSEEDILCLEDTSRKIYAQSREDCVDNLLCWVDERKLDEELPEQVLRASNPTTEQDGDVKEEIEEPKQIACMVNDIERELEGSDLPVRSDEGEEREFVVQKLVADVAESDEHDMQEAESVAVNTKDSDRELENRELVIAEDEESERDLEDSKLVIVEDTVMESEAEDAKLVVAEDEMKPEMKTKLVKEPKSSLDNENREEGSKVDVLHITDTSLEDDHAVTRYNLRRKSTLNYASLDKGKASRRKIVDMNDSPIRKVPKLEPFESPQADASFISTDQEFEVLSECNVNSIVQEDMNKGKSCLPKFYVENRVFETSKPASLPEKSVFEQVWSTIRNFKVDEPKLSNLEQATLVSCDDALLSKAFKLDPKIVRKPLNTKENMSKLNGVKRFIEEYMRSEKGLSQIAITNLLASIRLSNQATTCRALENVLLSKKHSNYIDRLVRICLEIDRKVFEGFVNIMKEHLREKMFATSFKVDENSNGLGMISSTILHSTFYAALCKETGNAEDAINLLYESLTCLKNRAHPIAYGVLSQWPNILNFQRHKGVLIDVMLFCYVHHKMVYNNTMYKITEVQELIGCTYHVKLGQKTAEEYAKDVMLNIFSDYWVDAIVLLCKRQMFSWAYTNVLMKYIIPLLRISKTETVQEALLLKVIEALRRVMSSCPYKKEETSMYNFDTIITALADILSSEKMSFRVLKENVYLAICELSSRRFTLCVESLSSWKPPDGKISSSVLSQLNEIMKMKGNFQNWAAFISPSSACRRLSSRKNKDPKETGKSRTSNENIIPIGLKRTSQNQAKQAKIHAEKNKTKPKKKKKKRKRQNSPNRKTD